MLKRSQQFISQVPEKTTQVKAHPNNFLSPALVTTSCMLHGSGQTVGSACRQCHPGKTCISWLRVLVVWKHTPMILDMIKQSKRDHDVMAVGDPTYVFPKKKTYLILEAWSTNNFYWAGNLYQICEVMVKHQAIVSFLDYIRFYTLWNK